MSDKEEIIIEPEIDLPDEKKYHTKESLAKLYETEDIDVKVGDSYVQITVRSLPAHIARSVEASAAKKAQGSEKSYRRIMFAEITKYKVTHVMGAAYTQTDWDLMDDSVFNLIAWNVASDQAMMHLAGEDLVKKYLEESKQSEDTSSN